MTRFRPPETPFPRHWLIYIVIKLAVIAVTVLIAFYLFGVYEVTL